MLKQQFMDNLQKFGKSLLLPITILAAVGIIVGFTASLDRPQVAALLPFMDNELARYVLLSIRTLSLQIFGLIPILFAISIAFGLANKQKEIAGLAGFIAYFTMLASARLMAESPFIDYPAEALISTFGLHTINMGAFGGIVAGLLGAFVHNKYCELVLPDAIAFFGGKRSVSIIVIGYAALIGQVLPFIWLPVSAAIHSLGLSIASMGIFGSFMYGFLENLLVPTGLHHILISIFRTTPVGGVLEIDGVVYEGAWNAFFAGYGVISQLEIGEFTRYLAQGRIPIFVFALPVSAIAMYHVTAKELRANVKPLLIAGALALFITGIQEPLLFLFLFKAPALFLFNAVMCGFAFMLMDLFNVSIGNTQGGVIDLTVYGMLVPESNWHMAVIVGLAFAAIYYVVFYQYLKTKNIVIAPETDASEEATEAVAVPAGGNVLARKIIKGLGGKDNIKDAYNCMTRLRVDINTLGQVDEKLLMSTGAVSVNKVSETHVQVIYGTKVDVITTQVNDELKAMESEQVSLDNAQPAI